MAWQTVHYFTSYKGNTYEVQYDADTHAVQTLYSPDFEPAVTEDELSFIAGTPYLSYCKGTTLIEVVAKIRFPFAYVRQLQNDPSCGPATPCTLAITSIVTEDETDAGAHNGMVTINTNVPAQYSLDNNIFQSSNQFLGLNPGSYVVYVSTGTCLVSGTFTIGAGAVAVADTPYPWQEKLCKFFRLLIPNGTGYTTHSIREPIKWDNVNFVGKRDKEWHGYRGMWSDGVIELEFDCPSGKDLLEAEYQAKGSDAHVLFHYGYVHPVKGDIVLFNGKLNFNVYKEFPGKVAMSVEKEDFNALLQSRFDTKVSMAEVKGFDGAVINPPPAKDFFLHAKEIYRTFSAANTENITADTGRVNQTRYLIHPDTLKTTLSEIEETHTYGLGHTAFMGDEHVIKAKFEGIYDININYTFNLTIWVDAGRQYYVKHYMNISGVETQVGSTITGHAANDRETVIPTAVFNYSTTGLLIPAGGTINFYTVVELDASTRMGVAITQGPSTFFIRSLDKLTPTICKGWLIHDSINQCIRVVTNDTSRLKSNFLSLQNGLQAYDGAGSLNLVTNGKQIRKFEVAKNPLQISLKDLMTSVRSIYCLGYGSERIGSKEVVRVERVGYFYQNKEMIVIEETYDWRREAAKDILYNEIEIGYDKFLDSGYNTLDEFNTKHEYVTPIKTNKLKLTAKSALIASGYSIEDSRRKQYDETTTDSYQNDDEGFIISVKKGFGEYVPEKNESFVTVQNLISPETAYNLKLSPTRMLLNWAAWLKNIFHYKNSTEIIKNTFVAQNGELKTRLKTTEPPIGDINFLEWQEKQDISLANYDVKERLFQPEYIFFKCRLTPDKIQVVNESMNGNWSSQTDYGYIVAKDPEGNYKAGYLMEVEYNYATEQAQFKLLEKYGAVTPGADCCNYLHINGCKLLINGKPIKTNV